MGERHACTDYDWFASSKLSMGELVASIPRKAQKDRSGINPVNREKDKIRPKALQPWSSSSEDVDETRTPMTLRFMVYQQPQHVRVSVVHGGESRIICGPPTLQENLRVYLKLVCT